MDVMYLSFINCKQNSLIIIHSSHLHGAHFVSAKAAVKDHHHGKLLPQPHAHRVQQCSMLILELPSDTYFRPHFFLTFYFVLGYSQLITLSQLQVNSAGIQPYIYINPFSPSIPSHLGCHIALSRVSCAISRSLLVICFYMSIPNSLTTPFPHPSVQQP